MAAGAGFIFFTGEVRVLFPCCSFPVEFPNSPISSANRCPASCRNQPEPPQSCSPAPFLLSRFPSRWCSAAGALLPVNYQPSPQMEMSVSLTGPASCHCLSPQPLYLGKMLPTHTMCFVTAD